MFITDDNHIGDRQVNRRYLGVLKETYGGIFLKGSARKMSIPAEHMAGTAEDLGPSLFPIRRLVEKVDSAHFVQRDRLKVSLAPNHTRERPGKYGA